MALTCPCCSGAAKRIAAPTCDGGYEYIADSGRIARRVNHNYRHDTRGWKTTTKARKQWARHTRKEG